MGQVKGDWKQLKVNLRKGVLYPEVINIGMRSRLVMGMKGPLTTKNRITYEERVWF